MYKNLLDEASKAKIDEVHVAALIRNREGKLLLLKRKSGSSLGEGYELPYGVVKSGETVQQALQRGVMETTNMLLQDVLGYFGHFDTKDASGKLVREYHFIVEVMDPISVEANQHHAFAWVNLEDASGYPIAVELRDTLDLFSRL